MSKTILKNPEGQSVPERPNVYSDVLREEAIEAAVRLYFSSTKSSVFSLTSEREIIDCLCDIYDYQCDAHSASLDAINSLDQKLAGPKVNQYEEFLTVIYKIDSFLDEVVANWGEENNPQPPLPNETQIIVPSMILEGAFKKGKIVGTYDHRNYPATYKVKMEDETSTHTYRLIKFEEAIKSE